MGVASLRLAVVTTGVDEPRQVTTSVALPRAESRSRAGVMACRSANPVALPDEEWTKMVPAPRCRSAATTAPA